MKIITKGLLLGAAGLAAVAGPATANHAWSTYHWERTGAEVTVPVIDNTTGIRKSRNHTGIAV